MFVQQNVVISNILNLNCFFLLLEIIKLLLDSLYQLNKPIRIIYWRLYINIKILCYYGERY